MAAAYKLAGSSYSPDEVITILNKYTRTNNAVSLEETATSILNLLPKDAALSTEIYGFGEDCFEATERTSYREQAHHKLARLLEVLDESGYFTSMDKQTGKVYRFQRLGESMRENLAKPDEENPEEYINYNSFIAHLHEHRIFPRDPSYAIWAIRDALEEDLTHETKPIRSALLLGGAQWILWNGQTLFMELLHDDFQSADQNTTKSWRSGSLYHGKGGFSLERWQFWKSRFEEVGKKFDVTDECKEVLKRAVQLMDVYESTLRF